MLTEVQGCPLTLPAVKKFCALIISVPLILTSNTVAHAPSQDDEYMGYKIPKGAGVIINVGPVNRKQLAHF